LGVDSINQVGEVGLLERDASSEAENDLAAVGAG
jgi:hypothetical protein